MNKLLIGAISGNYGINDVSRWVESSNSFDCERILILYNDTNKELVEYLSSNKIDIVVPKNDMYGQNINTFETNTGNNDIQTSYNLIHNIRFLHIWQILNEKKYDSVLITDVRDVYFNRDPFTIIGVDWLVASSEEIEYKNENWNKQHLFVNLGGIGVDVLMDKHVYNVGVFGGNAELVKRISRAIYLMSIGRKLVADQTSFNYLIQTSYKDFVRFTNLSDKFAVHLHVIANGLVSFDLNKIDEYAIVHQYDRL